LHDHMLDLRSLILYGEIQDMVYHLRRSAEGKYELFHAKYVDGVVSLESLNEYVNLISASQRVYQRGQEYQVKKGEMHYSRTPKGFTVTLINRFNIDPTIDPLIVRLRNSVQVFDDFDINEYDEQKARDLIERAIGLI